MRYLVAICMLACLLGGCVSLRPSGGSTLSQAENVQVGLASWYGKDFHGRRMADGGTYDMYGMMAAHKTLPLGTKVRVTNLANRKSVIVTIRDRGPYVEGRIIDLSNRAAKLLGMRAKGVSKVRIEVVR